MQVFILFLFTAFILGGTRLGDRPLSRPRLLVAFCVLVCASFWSLSVIS
jgi:hypothetical protein